MSNIYSQANTSSVYTECKGHQRLLILTNSELSTPRNYKLKSKHTLKCGCNWAIHSHRLTRRYSSLSDLQMKHTGSPVITSNHSRHKAVLQVFFNNHSTVQHRYITVEQNINTNIHYQLEELITIHVIISDNMGSNSSTTTTTHQITDLFTTTGHEEE